MPNVKVTIPVTVLTKKIAKNKTDSIFYAGKNIAEVVVGKNRKYVLTTSGYYSFHRKIDDPTDPISFDSALEDMNGRVRTAISKLTDAKIKKLGEDDLVHNWGWFGINVWVDNTCLPTPTEAYSEYDEAMEAFVAYIKQDLESRLNR